VHSSMSNVPVGFLGIYSKNMGCSVIKRIVIVFQCTTIVDALWL
jgi:hypothetical protein